jgi:DNA-binding MarR family transcriptional regulator
MAPQMNDDVIQASAEILQAEAKHVVSTCTCVHLRRAARAASHLHHQFLAPTGLGPGQFGILASISVAGSTTMTDLADSLVNDRTTITRNIALLERDGLVLVVPGRDRRVREITLTEAGKQKVAEAYPLWLQAQASIREKIGEDRLHQIVVNAQAIAALVTTPTGSDTP